MEYPPLKMISVLSAKRPSGADYLGDTLASIDSQGGEEAYYRFVSFDGPKWREIPAHWRYSSPPNHRGSRLAGWECFRKAASLNAERLLYCEDDVHFCKDAVRWCMRTTIPTDLAYLMIFDFQEIKPSDPSNVLVQMHVTGRSRRCYVGAQCILFPKWTIDYLAARSEEEVTSFCRGDVNMFDFVIGDFMMKTQWPELGVIVPSLVQHVGQKSMVNPNCRVVAARYAGDTFDALSLPEAGSLRRTR